MDRRSALLLPGAAMLAASVGAVGGSPVADAQVANSVLYREGPSGGIGGGAFADEPIIRGSRILQILVRSGAAIDAIQVVYLLPGGGAQVFPRHGGTGGGLSVLNLARNERILSVGGKFGVFGGIVVVLGLTIVTNRQSRSFGVLAAGSDFLYRAPPRTEIISFHGRSGALLDAVGVSLRLRGR